MQAWRSFFKFGKILPHSWEFDHHFCLGPRELDKKIFPGGRDSLTEKNFPGGCPGQGFPRPFTHRGICPPYGDTNVGGPSINGGTHEGGHRPYGETQL